MPNAAGAREQMQPSQRRQGRGEKQKCFICKHPLRLGVRRVVARAGGWPSHLRFADSFLDEIACYTLVPAAREGDLAALVGIQVGLQ